MSGSSLEMCSGLPFPDRALLYFPKGVVMDARRGKSSTDLRRSMDSSVKYATAGHDELSGILNDASAY